MRRSPMRGTRRGSPRCSPVTTVADLLRRRGVLRAFSSIFNYLPFHLANRRSCCPRTSSRCCTFPTWSRRDRSLCGRLGNRLGNGIAMTVGGVVFGAFVLLTLVPSVTAVPRRWWVCAGFSSCISPPWSVEPKLATSRGRGIPCTSFLLSRGRRDHGERLRVPPCGVEGRGRPVVILLLIPVAAGILEALRPRGWELGRSTTVKASSSSAVG